MRKLTAFVVLLVLSVVLVACTGEDEEPEPTAPPASTRIVESTREPTAATSAGITSDDEEASPETDVATPAAVEDDATPVMIATPAMDAVATPVASPVVAGATPVGSPGATPMDSAVLATGPQIVAIGGRDAPAPSPVPSGLGEPPVRVEMVGLVTLEGRENETYILTDEGCVGLGQYSGLHADRQVVIRNESGTIVSVTSLDASDSADGCAWQFVGAVPESEFYSVTIPMVFEQVFPKAQVVASDGEVVIELP